jgi:hypothetical protein
MIHIDMKHETHNRNAMRKVQNKCFSNPDPKQTKEAENAIAEPRQLATQIKQNCRGKGCMSSSGKNG